MRVCIVAEHASYKFGGEAVLPLHYFSRLRARGVETWLVVHSRTRNELLAAFPNDRDRIFFIEDAWFHKLLFRLSFLLPRRVSESTVGLLSQLITQWLARRIVRRLVREKSVDIVHQPIPVSPRFPSLITGVGAPVIIGPMNGGMEYPPAFLKDESAATRFFVWAGRHGSNLINRILPGKSSARVLLVANHRTRLALPSCAKGEVIEFPENGVDLNIWKMHEGGPARPKAPSRFVFMGRLVDWKRVDIAIEALRSVPDAVLEIIGDGPMKASWQKLAATLCMSSRVTFSGWLTQDMCASRLRSARAVLLPSIYESGGAVLLEAMASGIPVVATNWGGPSDYIDRRCGIPIDPNNRESMIGTFSQAMRQLARQPELARKMGVAGRRKVEQNFDWEKRLDRMLAIYSSVSRATGRPESREVPASV